MSNDRFDFAGVFDEDYLYFYEQNLTAERTDAEVERIWQLLALAPDMEVLDLACGHGRIANRLAARGCRVTGLDSSSLFLEHARRAAQESGVTVEYVRRDMRSLPWDARFDRVINWFTAFGYFDDDGNRNVLAEIRRVLKAGGRFVVDVPSRDRVMRYWLPSAVTERDGNLLIDRITFDPLSSRMSTERTIVRDGSVRTTHYFIRLFSFTELRDWCCNAGFHTVNAYGEDGQALNFNSQRMIVVGGVAS